MIEIPETFSQATAKKAGKVVLFAVLMALLFVWALRYFGVI